VNFVGSVASKHALIVVTEYCEYGSLSSSLVKHGSSVWDEEMKVKAMYDVACAMDFLHKNSIIHRDLKSDNALVVSLSAKSQVVCKVTDFGTAKFMSTASMSGNTFGPGTVGSLFYIAPEVHEDNAYSPKSDVYSFGVMMAEVANNGKINFSFEAGNQVAVAMKVMKGARPLILSPNGVPADYIPLLQECWNGEPEARPTFEDICIRLQKMLDLYKC